MKKLIVMFFIFPLLSLCFTGCESSRTDDEQESETVEGPPRTIPREVTRPTSPPAGGPF